MRSVSEKRCTEYKHTHFFFQKPCSLWYNVEKYCRTGRATVDSMEHAGFLGLQTHTQNIWYLLLSTATMVARRRLNVALYVHCLSCLKYPRSLICDNESAMRRRWRKNTAGRWQAAGPSYCGRSDFSVLSSRFLFVPLLRTHITDPMYRVTIKEIDSFNVM